MMKLLGAVAVLIPVLAHAAPLAEVWPYEAKRVDGGVQYAYDLTPVKKAGGTSDAKADNGETPVADFLNGLPREVKVFVPSAGITIAAARGVEDAPLAVSFSSSSDGPLAFDDPLRRKAKLRMRPAFDPEEPKILPSTDMVLWRVRRLEDGALAAAELDSDRLRKAWLQQLLERGVARMRDTQGDAHEGAVTLVARLSIALACMEPARLSVPAPVAKEAREQLEALRKDPIALVPLGFFAWTSELQCAWKRNYVLAQPFEASRAGFAAPLLLLQMLQDPKLKATWVKLRTRRDALYGGPKAEPLQAYLERTGGHPQDSLDDLVSAIDAWRVEPVPPILAAAHGPFAEFLNATQGAERLQAVEELSSAVQDGRLTLPSDPNAPAQALREAALAALATDDPVKGLNVDAVWRDRRRAAFCALQGAHHDVRESNFELAHKDDAARGELKVQLEVPPVVDVEPAPLVYRRAAVAAGRLAKVLSAENIGGVLDPEGGMGEGAASQLKHWQQVLSGLATISSPGEPENADTAAARSFLNVWRGDPALVRDVRFAAAGPVNFEDERVYAVVQGVARRELAVSFTDAPGAVVVGDSKPFVTDMKAEQRYVVPVLLTTSYRASATKAPMPYGQLRKAIDAAGRQPAQIPGAIAELSAPKQ
jgi:hypothetical protein